MHGTQGAGRLCRRFWADGLRLIWIRRSGSSGAGDDSLRLDP
jgi:hypothetical protein